MSLSRLSTASRTAVRRAAQSKRGYATPIAPAAAGTKMAAPNEWVAKRAAVQAHAAHTAGMWKKGFWFFCLPGLIVAGAYTKKIEDEHAEHMEHEKHEHGDEPVPQYSYMNKRQKPFPWGMNSLFFNPEVNKDMTATEE